MSNTRITLLALVSILGTGPILLAESKAKDKFFAPGPGFWDDKLDPSWVAESAPPAPRLYRQIALDFRTVFTSKETLLILGAGLGAAAVAKPFDQAVQTSGLNTEGLDGSGTDTAFEAGEVLGSSLVQVGGAFVTFGIGKIVSDPEIEALGRDLVRAQILSQAMTQILKYSVGRTRPDESNTRSFPSGHSSGAFATATVLQRRYGWKVGLPAYGVAGYVAASRLSENQHFLSDVVFGAAVGFLAGRTVTLGYGDTRFALSPIFTPGGAGLQVSLLPRE